MPLHRAPRPLSKTSVAVVAVGTASLAVTGAVHLAAAGSPAVGLVDVFVAGPVVSAALAWTLSRLAAWCARTMPARAADRLWTLTGATGVIVAVLGGVLGARTLLELSGPPAALAGALYGLATAATLAGVYTCRAARVHVDWSRFDAVREQWDRQSSSR